MTQQFRINETGIKEIIKSQLKRSIPLFVIVVVVAVVISSFNIQDKESAMSILPIILPVLLGVSAFSMYRGASKLKVSLASYVLTIEPNMITREQLNMPTISIYLNDISEIVKNTNRSFTIKGKTPGDIILIPAQIENYDQLEFVLNQIKPATTRTTQPLLQKYNFVFSILTLILMVVVYTSTYKLLVGICGTSLLGILSWSFYKLQTNKNVDSKIKRMMWWLIPVTLSIIYAMFLKLSA